MATVLAQAFANFTMLAEHSLLPTQTKMATRLAGNCLWALGVEEYGGFHAIEPEPIGEIIDGQVALRAIGEAEG
ncbi:hypothetical protein C4N9_20700 [Pararhodobacter marinus]|uniref:Uncharacterized protein n=2 Tax=Pararhodobacter marinus TaxID=2184063 RepID=A0A2U2C488_9RHOB|nr:hypothetical protein C4N9_20700 [Pararhodobacter marinus]